MHRIWSTSTQENEYYDDPDRFIIHNCPKKQQRIEEYPNTFLSEFLTTCCICRKYIYSCWEEGSGRLVRCVEKDKTTIHNCEEKKYSGKRTKEEVEKIMKDIIKFAIIMIKTNEDYRSLSKEEIERTMTVLIQSQIELYK